MSIYYADDTVALHHGDALAVLREMPDASVDCVITDPPYGLEFMGKAWDAPWRASDVGRGVRVAAERVAELTERGQGHSTSAGPYLASGVDSVRVAGRPFQEWCEAWARECLRVLKPGGHLCAFGGTRTYHRLTCAIEDAGFEVRDTLAWLYGAGFSKGGLLGNRAGIEWCACESGNAIPYDHASNNDLRGLRRDLHPAPVACGEGQDTDMLASVQREAPGRGMGEARPQGSGGMVAGDGDPSGRGDARREEPRLEGRGVHRAGQGLSDGADAGSPASAGERLRGGTPAGDGVADRAAGDASRGGASHQPGSGGQSAGEPEALPGSHEPLDDGARRGRVGCPRCGGLDPAFRGFSTTLKPAFEPIVVARKPLAGTVAANVLEHGTGALNIDGCRVGEGGQLKWAKPRDMGYHGGTDSGPVEATTNPAGRWPANVVLDEDAAAMLDEQSGDRVAGGTKDNRGRQHWAGVDANRKSMRDDFYASRGDVGGASRFFYTAKAPADERVRLNGTTHPTVKPLSLMRWLVRLVTPPGGTVLEPFAGSGTTVEACLLEGFRCVAIEREADYLPLIRQRLDRRRDPVRAVRAAHPDDGGLFDLLDGGEPA